MPLFRFFDLTVYGPPHAVGASLTNGQTMPPPPSRPNHVPLLSIDSRAAWIAQRTGRTTMADANWDDLDRFEQRLLIKLFGGGSTRYDDPVVVEGLRRRGFVDDPTFRARAACFRRCCPRTASKSPIPFGYPDQPLESEPPQQPMTPPPPSPSIRCFCCRS